MEIFYLKYRPQSLDDLIGQESVKKILKSSYEANKLSHAYLLVGPRGSGKTSTARILAKMVNCEGKGSLREARESGKGEVPCNNCAMCLSITDGSNLDLIEIDAASNRGIEDIRSLREKIKLAPASSKKKVYIIDEVHMLTNEAFNALLKTLEEPPAHAMFILATTDASKLPQTILSRVQRLDFKLASHKELIEALDRIIQKEKINIDQEALEYLVKKADGSFRDGVKLLDQAASFQGKITVDLLTKNLNTSSFDELLDLLKDLSFKKTAESLIRVQKILEEGRDIKGVLLDLMSMIRNLVLIKSGVGEKLVEPNFTEEKYTQLIELTGNFATKDMVNILDILQKALEKLKFSSIPSLPLELAVVEMTQSVILRNEVTKDLLQMQDSNKLRDSSPSAQNDKVEKSEASDTLTHRPTDTQNSSDSAEVLKLKEKWEFVLETIRPYNFSLEALLRSIKINECTQETIILEVPYSFHQRILEAPKNRDILEGILSEVLGRAMKISTILGSRPKRLEDVANIEVAADDEIIRVAAEIFNSEPN